MKECIKRRIKEELEFSGYTLSKISSIEHSKSYWLISVYHPIIKEIKFKGEKNSIMKKAITKNLIKKPYNRIYIKKILLPYKKQFNFYIDVLPYRNTKDIKLIITIKPKNYIMYGYNISSVFINEDVYFFVFGGILGNKNYAIKLEYFSSPINYINIEGATYRYLPIFFTYRNKEKEKDDVIFGFFWLSNYLNIKLGYSLTNFFLISIRYNYSEYISFLGNIEFLSDITKEYGRLEIGIYKYNNLLLKIYGSAILKNQIQDTFLFEVATILCNYENLYLIGSIIKYRHKYIDTSLKLSKILEENKREEIYAVEWNFMVNIKIIQFKLTFILGSNNEKAFIFSINNS